MGARGRGGSAQGRHPAPKAADATPRPPDSPASSSCLVTEWGEWDECSATCGMGMKKRHRMVKMSPADGSMCKAETSQAEKCMMPECREWAWEVAREGGRDSMEDRSTPCYHLQQGRRLGRCRGKCGPPPLLGTARIKIRAIAVQTSTRPRESGLLGGTF